METLSWMIAGIPLSLLLALRWYLSKAVQCPSKNRLDGKIVVVTGASSGVGLATATECARRGATVILACRERARAERALRAVRKTSGNPRLHFLEVDVSSRRSVREFVDTYQQVHGDKLDVLVNNAAYLGPKRSSEDGFDLAFHTNCLGPFQLTRLLVERLRPDAGRPLRVINLASDSVKIATLDLDDVMYTRRPYDIYSAYGHSKLALMLVTMETNYRHGRTGVLAMAVHPGAVRSSLMRHWPGLFGCCLRAAATLLFRSPDAGCQSVIYAAVADDIHAHLGRAIYDARDWPLDAHARDFRDAEALWKLCENLLVEEDQEKSASSN